MIEFRMCIIFIDRVCECIFKLIFKMCIQGDFDIVGGVCFLVEVEVIKVFFVVFDVFLYRFLGSV